MRPEHQKLYQKLEERKMERGMLRQPRTIKKDAKSTDSTIELLAMVFLFFCVVGGVGLVLYVAFYQQEFLAWCIVVLPALWLLLTIPGAFRNAVHRNGKRYGHYRD